MSSTRRWRERNRERKMIRYLHLLLLGASLTGCIPLTQTQINPSEERLIGHVAEDGSLAVGWKYEDILDESRKPKIDEKASYATSPKGKRYNLRIIPSNRDIGTYWRTASISLVDPSKPQSRVRWRSGSWKIHLEFLPPHKDMIFDNEVRIWTLFYNPIVHGPPN